MQRTLEPNSWNPQGRASCANQKPGGEGIGRAGRSFMGLDFVYVYVVFSDSLVPSADRPPDAYTRLSEIPWSRPKHFYVRACHVNFLRCWGRAYIMW